MNKWARRAGALLAQAGNNPISQHLSNAWLALVNERLDAEGLRGQVWGNMTYACESCGHRELRELEVGVEGPPHWRDDVVYIACAFSAGQCVCGGLMTHVNFSVDVEYETPQAPSASAVFRVPREWPRYPTRGMHEDGTVILATADSAFLELNLRAKESHS